MGQYGGPNKRRTTVALVCINKAPGDEVLPPSSPPNKTTRRGTFTVSYTDPISMASSFTWSWCTSPLDASAHKETHICSRGGEAHRPRSISSQVLSSINIPSHSKYDPFNTHALVSNLNAPIPSCSTPTQVSPLVQPSPPTWGNISPPSPYSFPPCVPDVPPFSALRLPQETLILRRHGSTLPVPHSTSLQALPSIKEPLHSS